MTCVSAFFRLSQTTKPELLQTQYLWVILAYFSNFSTKFTQNMLHHVVKLLRNFCETACNNYSKNTRFVFCFPRLLLVDFLPTLCSLHNSIMNILSLIGSRRTFGALSEGNIPFEIGHIIYMEINVSDVFFFFALYS